MTRAKKSFPQTLSSKQMVDFILDSNLRDWSGKLELQDAKDIAYWTDKWELKQVSLSNFNWVEDPSYKSKSKNFPPIMLLDNGKYEVLDGKHRIGMAKARGDASIVAYVGVPPEDQEESVVSLSWFQTHIKRLSSAMFQTFGLEEKLERSFKNRISETIRKHGEKYLDKFLSKNGTIFIGSSNVRIMLQPIFERHGYPPETKIPNRISFLVAHPDHQSTPKGSSAYFEKSGESYIIAVVARNMEDAMSQIERGNVLRDSITHELQHFLKSIYSRKDSHQKGADVGHKNYYAEEWEIQAYSTVAAHHAMDDIKDFYRIRTENSDDETKARVLDKLSSDSERLSWNFALVHARKFITSAEAKMGEKMDDKTKRRYYESVAKNFRNMMSNFISDHKSGLGTHSEEDNMVTSKKAIP